MSLLCDNGVIYLIAIQENKLASIEKWLNERNFESEIVIERKAGRERLYLLKISRTARPE